MNLTDPILSTFAKDGAFQGPILNSSRLFEALACFGSVIRSWSHGLTNWQLPKLNTNMKHILSRYAFLSEQIPDGPD